MVDITDLLEKVTGTKLSADEFVTLVQAVIENQNGLQDVDTKLADKVGYAVKVRVGTINYMYFFKDEETYNSWVEEPTEENGPIFTAELPADSEAASYVAKLETNTGFDIESSNRNVSVNLRFTSQYYNPIDQSLSDSGEDATVIIQKQMQGDDSWTTVGTLTSFPSVAANTGAYTSINLQPYLTNGTQYIRFAATGNISNATTTLITFTVSIAEMEVSFRTDWGIPFIYDPDLVSSHGMTIPVRISGIVYKDLYYELYNSLNVKLSEGLLEIGTTEYTETNYQNLIIPHPQIADVCSVRVRLRYHNTNVYTDWISQNILVSVKNDTTILLCVNNVITSAFNWTSQHLLDYAVYNPNVITSSVVKFEILDNAEETTWMINSNTNTQNNTIYDFTPYLSIENTTESGRVRLFAAKLRISVQETLMKTLVYSIDNSNDFAPTTGANFILMPSSRSNTDVDKRYIHNESNVTGEPSTILAQWTNVMFENDGWILENDVRRLRIVSGSKVTIPYESYSNTTQTRGLTIEVDFSTKNISNEEVPVFKMGKELDGQFVGLILYPTHGYFFKDTANVALFQDFEWDENTRTHIAVNIFPNLTINDRSVNVVRVFVNGIINREFVFGDNYFWDGSSSGGIQIGSSSADIDIYGIRIYKERQLSSNEIFNDMLSSVTDIDTKLALINANNIMQSGVIKYELAKDKYNTIVWHGVYPSKLNPIQTTGDLEINIINDLAHSGFINNMKVKGQGTSSKKYLKWNGSWSFNDDSVWVDGNGVEQGAFYKLTNTSPKATKLVGKINWASSPQAHKMGMCNIVNVLYDAIFNGSTGFEPFGAKELTGYENTKIAVEEKPFLFFVQEDENSEPVYYGNMTWGSAKGDKLTFGYDKKHNLLKNYLMIEGSDQTPILTLCQTPWFEDEVTYNEEEEYYEYNGQGSFDVTLGNMDSIGHFIAAFNQCFYYSTRIKYYNGSLYHLNRDSTVDKSYQYFIVGQQEDDSQSTIANRVNFKVYRYNWLTEKWVNAGITKDTNATVTNDIDDPGPYDEVYLPEQLGITLDITSADFDGILETVKKERIRKFREIAGNYFHVNDTLFGMQINKFMAASDNRAKNTYPYYDPIDGVVRFASDDNDTILPFNNQGQKQKPYWVEEHDYDSRPAFDSNFWAASGNVMYNLFEDAYPAELRSMMRKIMNTMNTLGTGYGSGGILGFFDRYFFSIQRYFPAVAYNECARLWYEYAKTLYGAGYDNDTDPITQSLGDQLQCERAWVKKRIVYMASYCMNTSFIGSNLEYRQLNNVTYNLIPSMKIYSYIEVGTSKYGPENCPKYWDYTNNTYVDLPKRLEAGESVRFSVNAGDSIQVYLVGSSLLTSLGDFSVVGIRGSIAFGTCEKLTTLKLGDDVATNVQFKPDSITNFPVNIGTLILTNIDSLANIGSLETLNKLVTFNSQGTQIGTIVLPQSNKLTTLKLNESLRSLTLRNQQNINTFDFTPTNLKQLTSGNCNVINQAFIENWLDSITENYVSYNFNIDNINWTNFTAERLVKLSKFGTIILKGTITMDANSISGSQMLEIRQTLGPLIDNGELILNYTNKISVIIDPVRFVGSIDTASFKAISLFEGELNVKYQDPDSTTFENTSAFVSLTNITSSVTNHQRIITGTLVGEEVSTAKIIKIRVSDGSAYTDAEIIVRAVSHISSVNVNAGNQYLSSDEMNTLENVGVVRRTITAQCLPNGFSDIPIIKWSFTNLRDIDAYYIDNGSESDPYTYIRANAGNTMVAKLKKQSATNNYTTVLEIVQSIESILNVADFNIHCEVYNGVSALPIENEAPITLREYYFNPYAVQTYDKNEPNYNPWFMLLLENIGALTAISSNFYNNHKIINGDNSIGYYVTIAEAASVNVSTTPRLSNNATDTKGIVYESYLEGVLDNTKKYSLTNMYCFRHFPNIILNRDPTNADISKFVPWRNTVAFNFCINISAMTMSLYGGNSIYCRFYGSGNIFINYTNNHNFSFTSKILIIDSYVTGFNKTPASGVPQIITTKLYLLSDTPRFQLKGDTPSVIYDKIYVPTSAVEDYKASTLFANYVNQIEGYDFDTDPDGVIDENKYYYNDTFN